jgi:hypothetical protein
MNIFEKKAIRWFYVFIGTAFFTGCAGPRPAEQSTSTTPQWEEDGTTTTTTTEPAPPPGEMQHDTAPPPGEMQHDTAPPPGEMQHDTAPPPGEMQHDTAPQSHTLPHQEPEPGHPQAHPQETPDGSQQLISQEEVETYAEIQIELAQLERQISHQAEGQTNQMDRHQQLQQRAGQIIQQSNMNLDRYNEITRLIHSDQNLLRRIQTAIDERVGGES